MSKSIASESLDHNESQKNGGKRGAEDEGIGDEESILEVPPAESLTISSTVSTAPPTWITKLRKIELRAELDDRLVKYEKKDKKFVLINLLILEIRMRARIPALNEDVMGHIVSFLGERRDGANGYRQLHPLAKNGDPFKSLRLAAQISRGFWIGAKRVLQQIIDQDQRNKDLRSKVKEWVKDQEGAMAKYGHISDWDGEKTRGAKKDEYKV
ncbi:hypothetical protein TL16_g02744 [Triparma laevis f. inornata]|uniref:Uncharacterized protein n=1 Tax=Triparma laevis f. inornata TaxID=1714386 RepID=A0A9W7DWJ4_9STRA|nr:hypothetical protein TL16_g02744 [Triparma laevis f. inornata]